MNEPESIAPPLDVDALAAWMDSEGLAGGGAPLEQRCIAGGTQNEIFEIRRGDIHAALRIPPPGAPETRDEGIVREWRIIEALGAGYIGDVTNLCGFPWLSASMQEQCIAKDGTISLFGSNYQDVFAFFVLILVLIFRPSGLLGERVADRA